MTIKVNTILLVEDDIDMQFSIQEVFKEIELKVSVKTVRDGMEAVEYLEGKYPYSNRNDYPLPILILTDVNMPRMTGLKLLEWIKQQPELKHLPVVVMSNSKNEDQVTLARILGSHSYFFKLSHFSNLVNIVQAIVAPEVI